MPPGPLAQAFTFRAVGAELRSETHVYPDASGYLLHGMVRAIVKPHGNP
ncbi:MAG TPA: hypothetical protein VEW46_01215 [Pyrinomonadaceae bacterium]|nr:hypothetical protein [Pyrinomonadaceae bacterium]